MRNVITNCGPFVFGFAVIVLLSGCADNPRQKKHEQKFEGVLEEVDGTGQEADWYRLKFKGGMTVVVFNPYEPFYVGHHQIIYYKTCTSRRGPYITRVVCKDYDSENPKNVVVKYEGDRIYVDKSKMVFGEKVYKMVPIEETMESVE